MEKDRRNKAIYYPMLISLNGSGVLVEEDAEASEWKKLKALPTKDKEILLSAELTDRLIQMQDRFGLSDDGLGRVSIFVRKLFFGEFSLADCEAKIGAMLAETGGGDPNQAKAIVEYIKNEILTIQPQPEAEETDTGIEVPLAATLVKLPLLQALSKYPNLGNQLVTRERIRVKTQPAPVRPSLLYWLKYYRDELGVGYHDNVQRGQFLFRSENGRGLSSEERERIGLLLKSVEEELPLTIDTAKPEIVFPRFETVPAAPRREPFVIATNAQVIKGPAFGVVSEPTAPLPPHPPVPQPPAEPSILPAGRGMLSFSSSQILPAEAAEERIRRAAAALRPTPVSAPHPTPVSPPRPSVPPVSSAPSPSAAPQSPRPRPAVEEDRNPFHIRPVSLGNRRPAEDGADQSLRP